MIPSSCIKESGMEIREQCFAHPVSSVIGEQG